MAEGHQIAATTTKHDKGFLFVSVFLLNLLTRLAVGTNR